MRMMIHVSIPVEAGNDGITSGKLMTLVQKFIADHKPDSAYFFADEKGNRSGINGGRYEGPLRDSGACGTMVSRAQRSVQDPAGNDARGFGGGGTGH